MVRAVTHLHVTPAEGKEAGVVVVTCWPRDRQGG
jgi:hypothetical protein